MGSLWGRLDFDGLVQDMAPSFGHVLRCVLTSCLDINGSACESSLCGHCSAWAGLWRSKRATRRYLPSGCGRLLPLQQNCFGFMHSPPDLVRTSTAVPGNFSATKMANAFGTVLAMLAGKARKLIWALEQGSVLQEIAFVRQSSGNTYHHAVDIVSEISDWVLA